MQKDSQSALMRFVPTCDTSITTVPILLTPDAGVSFGSVQLQDSLTGFLGSSAGSGWPCTAFSLPLATDAACRSLILLVA